MRRTELTCDHCGKKYWENDETYNKMPMRFIINFEIQGHTWGETSMLSIHSQGNRKHYHGSDFCSLDCLLSNIKEKLGGSS